MEHPDEPECIRRILKGNHAVYGILVDRYKTLAYSIALKVLGNVEDAEDVAQESFIKAYQQLHRFEGKAKFSTWLYTIVYRAALAKAQLSKVNAFSISEQFRENFTNDHSVPQLTLMKEDDDKRCVQDAINKLPKTEALLVMLYYINENSISEIQEITGFSTANIKIKLFRARKKLERELRFLLDDTKEDISGYGK